MWLMVSKVSQELVPEKRVQSVRIPEAGLWHPLDVFSHVGDNS